MIENSPVSERPKSSLAPPGSPPRPPAHQSHLGKLAIFVFAAATMFVLLETFYVFSRRHSPIPSVAILPFASSSPSSGYLSRGITEGVARALSQLPRLGVIGWDTGSYGAIRQFDPQQLAGGLQARTLLSGEVRQQGDGLTVTIRLIDARTGVKQWEGRYNGKISEAQAIQQQIARAVCDRLRLKLGPQEQQKLARPDTQDAEAYQFYLQGRYLCGTLHAASQAIDDFDRAIARDPAYALAYAGRAACYNQMGDDGSGEPGELFPRAKAAAMKALQLDPQLAEAHLSLAIVDARYDFDWPGADGEFKRAIALDPNDAAAHQGYGLFLAAMGDLEGAMREMSRAQELDPLSPGVSTSVADIWRWSRDYREAIREYRMALELDPHFRLAREGMAIAYALSTEYAQGVKELQDAAGSPEPASTATLAWIDAASGDKSRGRKLLADLIAPSQSGYVSPVRIASVEAALGDQDQVFAWLDRAYQARDSRLALLEVLPEFDSLRSDPRFAALLRRLRLPVMSPRR